MVDRYCNCCQHLAGWPDAAANFYKSHFIPDGWKLHYSGLSECYGLTLTGHCKDCHSKLEELIPLPEGLAGDDLLKAIYDTMQTTHPYDQVSQQIGYYGDCEERSLFYTARDKRGQFRRSTQFLDLFNDYDREQARLWLETNFPSQKHTEVFRDTGGSLFCSVVRLAKENGDFGKAAAILDYTLPNEHENSIRESVKLTAYEFNFEPVISYGCEGIYIDCCLVGKFDESGRSRLHVGTLKTLKQDMESAKIMGELCGALMHHASQYVNANLHRYTPNKQLENEEQQQKLKEQQEASGGEPSGESNA